MQSIARRSRLALGVGVGAIALSAGVAGAIGATTPDSIHGCVTQKSGALRVVSEGQACRSGEVHIEWNRTGPAGPAGGDGAPGTHGISGYERVTNELPFSETSTEVAPTDGAVFCPDGKKVLSGGYEVRDVRVDASHATEDGRGWRFRFVPESLGETSTGPHAIVHLICAYVEE